MRNNRGRCSPAGRMCTTVEGTAMTIEPIWRKSSYSGEGESCCVEVSWRKSSYSGQGATSCVEVAFPAHSVAVRDSKNVTGPVLAFPVVQWEAFLLTLR